MRYFTAKNKNFLYIIFFLLGQHALAQGDYRPGYIVKSNGDSLPGLVHYANYKNSEQCKFKRTRKDKASAFFASDLQAYGFSGDKRYESIIRPQGIEGTESKIFVKTLAKGPLRLYRYKKIFIIEKKGHTGYVVLPIPENKIVDTKQGRMIQNDHRYKDLLDSFLEESNLSASKTGYSEVDLARLINNYNRLNGYVPPENKLPALRFNYEIVGGYVTSNMNIIFTDRSLKIPASHSVIGGLGLNISSPRIYDKIALTFNLLYGKSFYQGYYESIVTGDELSREDILIDVSYLKTPVGFKYNFGQVGNSLYVKAGFSPYFILSSDIRTVFEVEFNNAIKTKPDFRYYGIKSSQGISVGLGYERMLLSRLKVFVELQGEKTNGFIKTPFVEGASLLVTSSSVNYTFLIGLRF